MSTKGDGVKIKVTFDQELVGDVSGLTPNPIGGYKKEAIDTTGVVVTALNQYSNYVAHNVIDKNENSYWYGTTSVNWLRFQLPSPQVITGLRLKLGSYYIKTFTFSGSNDGETWTALGDTYSAATSSTSQWYEFIIPNTEAYTYYRIDTVTTYSSAVFVYEAELQVNLPVGNEFAFSVEVPEYNYVPGGTIEHNTRQVKSVYGFAGVEIEPDLSSGNLNQVSVSDTGVSLGVAETVGKGTGILTEPSSYSTASYHYEMGWRFTVGAEDILIRGLRVKFPAAQSTVGHLWNSNKELIAECPIEVTEAATWAEAEFETPTVLKTGQQYTISCYHNKGWYYSNASNCTFDPRISYVKGAYIGTQNAFPSSNESNRVYPMIDLVFGSQKYHTSGSAEYTVSQVNKISKYASSQIRWDENVPEGTELNVFAKIDDGEYKLCTNGAELPEIARGTDLTHSVLYIKAELSTTDTSQTPEISNLRLTVSDLEDNKSIVLELYPGNTHSIQNAVEDVVVHYHGGGNLRGLGGPVAPFDWGFTGKDLIYKGHQNDAEHLEISNVVADGNLMQIYYSDYKSADEHISITNITAIGKLTSIDDI